MRSPATLLLLVAMAAALAFFSYRGCYLNNSPRKRESVIGGVTKNRKLKENMPSFGVETAMTKRDFSSATMEDYPRFDPAPSSKAAVVSGPIEHGTPLMPYVPGPTPSGLPPSGPPDADPSPPSP